MNEVARDPGKLAENIFVLRFPLRLFGMEIGRNVTVIRLRHDRLVIHSTAPFDGSDVRQIGQLGTPAWLVDATCFHDTYAQAGREAFPNVPYLAPPDFPKTAGVPADRLIPAPAEWEGELQVLALDGIPRIREHVFFHVASRTLIVGDVLFNLGQNAGRWARFFMRHVARIHRPPDMSPFFRLMIRDRAAFAASARAMLAWDFERIIVAHGEPVTENAKERFAAALGSHGLI